MRQQMIQSRLSSASYKDFQKQVEDEICQK